MYFERRINTYATGLGPLLGELISLFFIQLPKAVEDNFYYKASANNLRIVDQIFMVTKW